MREEPIAKGKKKYYHVSCHTKAGYPKMEYCGV
jgi:hypothetical protein